MTDFIVTTVSHETLKRYDVRFASNTCVNVFDILIVAGVDIDKSNMLSFMMSLESDPHFVEIGTGIYNLYIDVTLTTRQHAIEDIIRWVDDKTLISSITMIIASLYNGIFGPYRFSKTNIYHLDPVMINMNMIRSIQYFDAMHHDILPVETALRVFGTADRHSFVTEYIRVSIMLNGICGL
jgi:hypothetical protein